MLAPVNLTDENLEITLSDESGEYIKFQVEGKEFVAGKAYAYFLTDEENVIKNVYNAVDLGLPSGTLWADRNVGADAPEAYGDYFAWGETEPKSVYDWSTYKWCNGSSSTMTKYCTSISYGTVDNKKVLDLEDDAAYVNMGTQWRMPTIENLNELKTYCTKTTTTLNGVTGYKYLGPNGNSIFLPAAGQRLSNYVWHLGSECVIWSSSIVKEAPNTAFELYAYYSSYYFEESERCEGHQVRAIYNSNE
jgi:hypothetical protein